MHKNLLEKRRYLLSYALRAHRGPTGGAAELQECPPVAGAAASGYSARLRHSAAADDRLS